MPGPPNWLPDAFAVEFSPRSYLGACATFVGVAITCFILSESITEFVRAETATSVELVSSRGVPYPLVLECINEHGCSVAHSYTAEPCKSAVAAAHRHSNRVRPRALPQGSGVIPHRGVATVYLCSSSLWSDGVRVGARVDAGEALGRVRYRLGQHDAKHFARLPYAPVVAGAAATATRVGFNLVSHDRIEACRLAPAPARAAARPHTDGRARVAQDDLDELLFRAGDGSASNTPCAVTSAPAGGAWPGSLPGVGRRAQADEEDDDTGGDETPVSGHAVIRRDGDDDGGYADYEARLEVSRVSGDLCYQLTLNDLVTTLEETRKTPMLELVDDWGGARPSRAGPASWLHGRTSSLALSQVRTASCSGSVPSPSSPSSTTAHAAQERARRRRPSR